MLTAVLALLAALGLAVVGTAPAQAQSKKCANANAGPGKATPDQLRKAVMCLINAERAKRNLGNLRGNRRLRKAATRHNNLALKRNCQIHRCGGTVTKRARRSGYLKGARRFQVGEVFHCAGTPRQIVAAWMGSRLHREIVTRSRYRQFGAAVRRGKPVSQRCPGKRTISVTVALGWRT